MSYNLSHFIRDNAALRTLPDYGEILGDLGFGILSIGFGNEIEIKHVKNSVLDIEMREKEYSPTVRILAIVLSILFFPLTSLLAVIGSIGNACSQSRKNIIEQYIHHKALLTHISELETSGNLLLAEHPQAILLTSGKRKPVISDFVPKIDYQTLLESITFNIPKGEKKRRSIWNLQNLKSFILINLRPLH
jgi:hypothetical protein